MVKNPHVNAGAVRDIGSVLGWEELLEKSVPTPSRTLDWRIARTEGAGGLQSMGRQRVGHGWSDLAHKKGYLACYLPTNLLSYSFTHYVVPPYTYCTTKYDI